MLDCSTSPQLMVVEVVPVRAVTGPDAPSRTTSMLAAVAGGVGPSIGDEIPRIDTMLAAIGMSVAMDQARMAGVMGPAKEGFIESFIHR